MTATRSLDALLTHIVDYAGLFPPAKLDMADAIREYATYRREAEHGYLGRFVVPITRLDELDDAAAGYFPRGEGNEPWRISALVGADLASDVAIALRFNCEHWSGSERGHAVIDAIEWKADSVAAVEKAKAAVPDFFATSVEIPVTEDPAELVGTLGRVGFAAKIRTGGVTRDAFPAPKQVVRFLLACHRAGARFKATAGLHHPIRDEYRLTYAPDSVRGTMYGFLNVFLCAAFLRYGLSAERAEAVLLEESISAFEFDDGGVRWQDAYLTTDRLVETRADFALSFGSCSFREPIDDLRTNGLL